MMDTRKRGRHEAGGFHANGGFKKNKQGSLSALSLNFLSNSMNLLQLLLYLCFFFFSFEFFFLCSVCSEKVSRAKKISIMCNSFDS